MNHEMDASSVVRQEVVAAPALLSLLLLAAQLALMVWGSSFPTQDGPVHLHTALVWRSLLVENGTLFHQFCELAAHLPPNLLTLVVLELLTGLLEPARAVQAFAILCVALLYGSVAYARRAVFPGANCFDPSINVLVLVLFLVLGLFNFYLGTSIVLLATGYLLRRADGLKAGDYAWLVLVSLLLYATHLFALLIGCMALVVTFVFVRLWPALLEWGELTASERPLRLLVGRLRGLIPLLASLSPGLVWAAVYMARTKTVPTYFSLAPSAWHDRFQEFVMALSILQDRSSFLLDALLGLGLVLIAAVAFSQWLRQREQRAGAMWAVTMVLAAMFFITPERVGLGMFLPQRLAWTALLFAVVASGRLLASSRRSAVTAMIFSLLFAVKLTAFAASMRDARDVLAHYEKLGQELPAGCTVLQINYPTPALDRQYGLARLYFGPVYHAADGFARAKRCFSWGNYQVLTGELQFPVQLRPEFRADAQGFYKMEFAPNRKAAILKQLLPRYAEKIDFILLAGEPGQAGSAYHGGEELAADFQSAVVLIESQYERIAADGQAGSLRLYRRRSAPRLPEPQD